MDTESRLQKLEQYCFTQNTQFQNDVFKNLLLMTERNNGIGFGKLISQDIPALIEVTSTSKGVRFPRMTTEQRDAIVNPVDGLVIYNLDQFSLETYDGIEWNTSDIAGYTTVLRDALTNKRIPTLIYNTDTEILNLWNGIYWMDIGIAFYSTTERNALTAYTSQVIYNTDTDKLNVYTTAWEAITST